MKSRQEGLFRMLKLNICVSCAGANVQKEGDTTGTVFRFPSYVQHIMGDIFSLGFGPFRFIFFVCSEFCVHSLDTNKFCFREPMQTRTCVSLDRPGGEARFVGTQTEVVVSF